MTHVIMSRTADGTPPGWGPAKRKKIAARDTAKIEAAIAAKTARLAKMPARSDKAKRVLRNAIAELKAKLVETAKARHAIALERMLPADAARINRLNRQLHSIGKPPTLFGQDDDGTGGAA